MVNTLKILAIADLHYWEEREIVRIGDLEYDCCCLLGDIPEDAISAIREQVHKPLLGVLGNHDTFDVLRSNGVEDIDKRAVVVNGVTLAGLSGSHRYKFGEMHPMLTQWFDNEKTNRTWQDYNLDGINKFCGTSFTHEDMELVYEKLGNGVKHTLTIKFIVNECNLDWLRDYKQPPKCSKEERSLL